jgi:erythromycin esterase-like protein
MVVFGFLFYQGSFNAYLVPRLTQLHVFQVGPPAGDSYESFLHSAGMPLFFLDLRTVSPDSTAAGWLLAPHPFRMVGCCYDPNNPWILTTMSLAKEFDAVIYIQDTSPSELLEP